jgi:hypothetical protein
MAVGYKLEDAKRILTKEEAVRQLSHGASLFRAILGYVSGGHQSRKMGLRNAMNENDIKTSPVFFETEDR